MAMNTNEGELPMEYLLRRIYAGDKTNPYIGSCDNREIIKADDDILYGKREIEAD